MKSYSLRCRGCSHRRTSFTHPDHYQRPPRCSACGSQRGWRVVKRYVPKNICHCNGPDMAFGRHYPHKTTHPLCDKHPKGYYNQARHMGIPDHEIPVEFGGTLTPEKEECLTQSAFETSNP